MIECFGIKRDKMNKPNLENDLLQCDWIREKCEKSESYSQNLYASLCNRIFMKDGEEWTCSWRYAGGIVADLRNKKYSEDYLHWYCSGIYGGDEYIGEGDITGEITKDLLNLGWTHRSYE
jgi:hypothetical protein